MEIIGKIVLKCAKDGTYVADIDWAGRRVHGRGSNPVSAYRAAEIKLVLKPFLICPEPPLIIAKMKD